jgi:hypothetical protein
MPLGKSLQYLGGGDWPGSKLSKESVHGILVGNTNSEDSAKRPNLPSLFYHPKKEAILFGPATRAKCVQTCALLFDGRVTCFGGVCCGAGASLFPFMVRANLGVAAQER